MLENKFNNLKSLDYTSKFVWLLSAHDILTLQKSRDLRLLNLFSNCSKISFLILLDFGHSNRK
jgi:hypothetical protein